jgi:hypothetical protein
MFLCHSQAFEKHMHEAMRERQEKRHSGKTWSEPWNFVVRDTSTWRDLITVSCLARFWSRRNVASRPIGRGQIFHNYGITRILLGTHARCKCFSMADLKVALLLKWQYFFYMFLMKTKYVWDSHLVFFLRSFRGLRGRVIWKKLLAFNRYWFDTHSERRTIHARKPAQVPNAEYLSACARYSYRVRTQ